MTPIEIPPRKDRGNLILLHPSRKLTSREFNALPFEERLERVRAVGGKAKYELLLDAHDAERLVHRLPPQEVFLLIKELGKDDVPELILWSSTHQITTFLDLDCWDRDVLDGEKALEWLALILEGGEEKVFRTAVELEFELLVLILKKLMTVKRGPEDYLDEDARIEAVQRDGGYEIEYGGPESAKVTAAFVEILFRKDLNFYVQLMEAVRWEQESLLEEDELRLRSGRLQDQGFPDPFEALSVYAWLDPALFDPAEWKRGGTVFGEPAEAPSFVLTTVRPRGLLAEILAEGVDPETCWELTYLFNRVIAADRIDMGDAAAVRETVREVYRHLNLALEHLAGGDIERGAELFSGVHLQALFRLGFSLTLRLRDRARKLAASPVSPYLDEPFRNLVSSLDRKKPRFFEGIENSLRSGERPFAELREIRLAQEWLDRLEVQKRLFTGLFPFELPAPGEIDLSGCLPEEPDDLTLSDFFLTALANKVLGREFLPLPIAREELPALQDRVCAGGKIAPELREETVRWLDSLAEGGGAFGAWCLDIWEEEFCVLSPDALASGRISGLIVR